MRRRQLVALVLLALLGHALAREIDLIVALRQKIKFLGSESTQYRNRLFNDITAIAYDPIGQALFIADELNSTSTLINSLNLKNNEISDVITLPTQINNMAYDPVANVLYFSNPNFIYSLPVLKNVVSQPPLSTIYQKKGNFIRGITVDICRGILYAIDSTVILKHADDSLTFDPVLIDPNIKQASGIAVDPVSENVYWLDDKFDALFSLHRAKSDGSDQETVFVDRHHHPDGIVYHNDSISWIESKSNTLWRYDLNAANGVPYRIYEKFEQQPTALIKVVNVTELVGANKVCRSLKQALSDVEVVKNNSKVVKIPCLNGGEESNYAGTGCVCPEEFTGEYCQFHKCHNYCVHGNCNVEDGKPICKCNPGYKDQRCAVQEPCSNYCQNNGTCVYSLHQVSCNCTEGYSGESCEIKPVIIEPKNITELMPIMNRTMSNDITDIVEFNSTSLNESEVKTEIVTARNVCQSSINVYLIPSFCAVLILLLIIIMFLTYKLILIRRNPRIIKKIIGRRTSKSFSKKAIRNGCEITIEDCCNMNSCETPCFEPIGSTFCDRGSDIDLISDKYYRIGP